jgi:hypothetical protein
MDFVYGSLRGFVLGLASMPLAGPASGAWFGLMCAATLNASYALGFAPADEYEAKSRPRISPTSSSPLSCALSAWVPQA